MIKLIIPFEVSQKLTSKEHMNFLAINGFTNNHYRTVVDVTGKTISYMKYEKVNIDNHDKIV